MDSTIWEFVGNLNVTGTDANPQMFTIDHDDGVTLLINGQFVINSPGPSFGPPNPFFFSSGLYTGGAGVVPFELVYAECCGFPARLKTDLPEPSAVLLLGTVLLGLGFKFKRKISPRSHCSTEVSEAQR
jgi:hypothetical protein